jgi:hypothetical protein
VCLVNVYADLTPRVRLICVAKTAAAGVLLLKWRSKPVDQKSLRAKILASLISQTHEQHGGISDLPKPL